MDNEEQSITTIFVISSFAVIQMSHTNESFKRGVVHWEKIKE